MRMDLSQGAQSVTRFVFQVNACQRACTAEEALTNQMENDCPCGCQPALTRATARLAQSACEQSGHAAGMEACVCSITWTSPHQS